MKKTLTLLLALTLVAILTLPAHADDTVYTHGTLRYTVADQSVTIVGAFGSSREITVPAAIGGTPVNTIAPGAFADRTALETLNLPDTITAIGENAIPDGVQVVYNSNTDPSLVPPALLRQSQTPAQEQTPDAPEHTPEPAPQTPAAPQTPTSGDAVSEAETDLAALERRESPASTPAPAAQPAPADTAAPAASGDAAPEESTAPAPAQLGAAQTVEAGEETPAAAAPNHGVWYLIAAAAVLTAALVFVVLRLHRR